ncbi:MAG: hypothetical protein KA015_05955 [Spirochaetes bacterium]|nr:hypothetical protein [Spirochaetota bacterium]
MENISASQDEIISSLRDAKNFAEHIVETIREPLLVLSFDLKVIFANNSFYNTFKVIKEETEGKLLYSLGNNQWDIPELKNLLENIIPNNSIFNDYEVRHNFNHIGERIMHLNARRINSGKIILLAIEDVTERIKYENELQFKNKELQIALSEIKELRGILPICSFCKKIRNDKGYWEQIEVYIHDHTDADFSHSICPECFKKNYPEFKEK